MVVPLGNSRFGLKFDQKVVGVKKKIGVIILQEGFHGVTILQVILNI